MTATETNISVERGMIYNPSALILNWTKQIAWASINAQAISNNQYHQVKDKST